MSHTKKILRASLEGLIGVAIYVAIFEALEYEPLFFVIGPIIFLAGLFNGSSVVEKEIKKKYGLISFKQFSRLDRVLASIALFVLYILAASLSMLLSPFLIGEFIANKIIITKEEVHEKLDQ